MSLFKFLLTLVFLQTVNAHADVVLKPMLLYSIDKTQSTTTTTTTRQLIDFQGGYLSPDGWAILGMYGQENITDSSNGSSSSSERSCYGAGGGWFGKQDHGVFIDAIYFIDAKLTGGGNTYKGDGWQADLGYKFSLGSSVSFAAQFAYRNLNFKKLNSNTLSPAYVRTKLDPMIGFVFQF